MEESEGLALLAVRVERAETVSTGVVARHAFAGGGHVESNSALASVVC